MTAEATTTPKMADMMVLQSHEARPHREAGTWEKALKCVLMEPMELETGSVKRIPLVVLAPRRAA